MDIVFDLLVAQLFPEDPHTTGNAAPNCLLPSCTQELWCLPSETQLYLIPLNLDVSDHVPLLVVASCRQAHHRVLGVWDWDPITTSFTRRLSP
jgi:hypothetical protein